MIDEQDELNKLIKAGDYRGFCNRLLDYGYSHIVCIMKDGRILDMSINEIIKNADDEYLTMEGF
jgi:hypothetical protein